MGPKSSEILLVGSELGLDDRLCGELLASHFILVKAIGLEDSFAKAMEPGIDVVVSDLLSQGLPGLDLLKRLHVAKPHLPVIMLASNPDGENVIEATKLGAYDFMVRPFELVKLLDCIARAAVSKGAVASLLDLGQSTSESSRLVGSSQIMQELYKQIGLAAVSSATVLIRGATGTGKELMARAIHQHSSRAKEPFVTVTCSAIPEALFESELFGYEPGAFTGARSRRLGYFEVADRGTLFLDEVGELPLATQVKLLRVLQERRIQRLGGRQDIPLDIRVVAATNRDLERALAAGEFRQDLFYRLSDFTIKSAELCEHKEDIVELVRHFLRKWQWKQGLAAASIHMDAVEFLVNQPWPGNVRQLEHVVNAAAVLAGGRPINLPYVRQACGYRREDPVRGTRPRREEPLTDLLDMARAGQINNVHARVLEHAERRLFERAMEIAKGNRAHIAHWLGITRTTVREKLRRFGMAPSAQKNPSRNNVPLRIRDSNKKSVLQNSPKPRI